MTPLHPQHTASPPAVPASRPLESDQRTGALDPDLSAVERFVRRRQARWERLSALLQPIAGVRARRDGLALDELNELVELYRRATADLAIAQRDFPGDRVTAFLNQLVGRGYAVIYREPPAPTSRLRRYFAGDLPRAYRAAWPYLLAAALLFFLPLITTLVAIIIVPDSAALLVAPGQLAEIKSGHTWFATAGEEHAAIASFIMTNNIRVALLALGGGMLGGVGTIFVLVANGLAIGALTGALIAHGLGKDMLGFISPHGFLELSVVVLAGACGLMLARALVWPGLVPRADALATAGARAVQLLLGMLPFLVLAGLLEGFVSPLAFAWQAKLAIGAATAVGLYAYLLLVGRSAPGAALTR